MNLVNKRTEFSITPRSEWQTPELFGVSIACHGYLMAARNNRIEEEDVRRHILCAIMVLAVALAESD